MMTETEYEKLAFLREGARGRVDLKVRSPGPIKGGQIYVKPLVFASSNPLKEKEPTNLQNRFVAVRSKSACEVLLEHDQAKLIKLLSPYLSPVPLIPVTEMVFSEETSDSWIYSSGMNSFARFDNSTCSLLDTAQQAGRKEYLLDSGTLISFTHMVMVSTNSECFPVARIPKLAYKKKTSLLHIICEERVFPFIKSAILSIEQALPVPSQVPCISMIFPLCESLGVTIDDGLLYGSATAIDTAMQQIAALEFSVFRDIFSLAIPENVPPNFFRYLQDRVLIVGQMIFGGAAEIQELIQKIEQFDYSAECPPGLDELDIAMVCSEFGIEKVDDRLVGSEQLVQLALEKLRTTEVALPPIVEETDLAMMLSMFPVEITGSMIKGSRLDVAQAIAYLQSIEVSESIPTNSSIQTVQSVVAQFGIRLEGVKIVGKRESVQAALLVLHEEEINASMAQSPSFRFHRNDSWFEMQRVEFSFDELSLDNDKCTLVIDQFYDTMKGVGTISRVIAIYNKRMYTNFAYKHEALSAVEGRPIETMMLFHGTRGNDPKVIYESDEGLDSRLGHGMWGSGTYYAKDARYSHNYAFHTPNQYLQMFLCEVIVGDYVTLQPQSLMKPPQKPNSTSCYHSVKGNTQGSDIWITYEVSMSYPKYLIEYMVEGSQANPWRAQMNPFLRNP